MIFIMFERRWFVDVLFVCICHLTREMFCDLDYCDARIYESFETQWKKNENYRLLNKNERIELSTKQTILKEIEKLTNKIDRANEQ